MSAWKQFVSAALVGTSQAKAPPLPAALEPCAPPEDESARETSFLSAAAALSLWRRAGWKPLPSVPAPQAAEPEERPSISALSADHLRRMLRGDFAAFLPAWLQAVNSAGLRLPFELLPAVLDSARQSRELRPLVSAVAGRRGAWLAAQNPDWNFAAAETEDLWETGTRDQRASFLLSLRRRDPAAALNLLQTTWKSDPADARTAFLGVLEEGLSTNDEPFLEGALDDRSKEVRRAAAALLARLPESRLVARMTARAVPLLAFKAGKLLTKASLTVSLPPEPDSAATRDGLDPKAFAGEKKFGEKAALLLQILSAVPPSHWTAAFDTTPDKLVAAARKDEFARAVISGWAGAAFRFRDIAWAETLLAGPLPMDEWLGVGPTFLNVLPGPRRAEWLAERVRARGLLERKYSAWNDLLPALLAFESSWPESLAREVAAALSLIAKTGFPWHLRAGIPQLLLRLPPELAAQAAASWPADQEGVTELAEFVAFRLEALNALSATQQP